MKAAIFRDRLGFVSTESLLRSLPNPSSSARAMDLELIRSQSQHGFEVSADFELSIRDTMADQTAFMTGATRAEPAKRLVRLVLEPLVT
jgi:hypothetical protein